MTEGMESRYQDRRDKDEDSRNRNKETHRTFQLTGGAESSNELERNKRGRMESGSGGSEETSTGYPI